MSWERRQQRGATMVISDELKFPRIRPVEPYRADRKVEAVDGTPPVARIGAFKREWNRRRGALAQPAKRATPLTAEEAEGVRQLVNRVNTSLEDHQILIHLVLIRTEDGFGVDVYDCTGNEACTVVKDFELSLADLPVLLRNLEEEAGLLIDTVS
ncbi:MAG: hypothetical protein AB1456_02790 [Thermodesulfobacteriota bacterium]